MATLKDIANLAGVSQGTVSNVLNGRGNVSSKKIKLVESAAAQLGYTVNERAKLLRKGSSNILALVMPNTGNKRYNDIYLGFRRSAEEHEYTVSLYLTDDIPDIETGIISKLKSDMVAGVAVISCLDKPMQAYTEAGFSPKDLLFLERGYDEGSNYLGFDYSKAGSALAEKVTAKYSKILVLTESPSFYNGKQFISNFKSAVKDSFSGKIIYSKVHSNQCEKDVIEHLSSSDDFDCMCTDSFLIAEAIGALRSSFSPALNSLPIYTASPVKLLPDRLYKKYEFDYHRLGNQAADSLIDSLSNESSPIFHRTLENTGFREWTPALLNTKDRSALNLLMLNGPEAVAVKHLSKLYTEMTGIPICASVYSYDEIFDILSCAGGNAFDILRIDTTFLSWFAKKVLIPLDEMDKNIGDLLPNFLDGVAGRYSLIDGRMYALPFSPSVQILYYRKDLFNSTVLKRLYYEEYKCELAPPQTFKEFNRIAAFFTKEFNPNSPVEYGTSLTLGSIGVAGSEFMARLLEKRRNLYDDNGEVRLNGEDGLRALSNLIGLKECAPANAWWTDTAKDFAEGRLAMAILYSNYASDLLGSIVSSKDKIGYTLVPGHNPVLGGASLGVSKLSTKKEQALNFIKWLCSETISAASTILGGVSPCKAAYNNYELLDAFPWMRLTGESFSIADGYRQPPDDPEPFNERQFLSIIGMAVKNAYNGIQSPQVALDWAQEQYMHYWPPKNK